MRESNFQSEFNKWLRHNGPGTGAYELKIAKDGAALPFKALQPHQKDALIAAKHGRVVYKIPDDSIAAKPFDAFSLALVPAFVVVYYYLRGEKRFYMIDIDNWCEEEKTSSRKSLTEARAREVGTTCYLI